MVRFYASRNSNPQASYGAAGAVLTEAEIAEMVSFPHTLRPARCRWRGRLAMKGNPSPYNALVGSSPIKMVQKCDAHREQRVRA